MSVFADFFSAADGQLQLLRKIAENELEEMFLIDIQTGMCTDFRSSLSGNTSRESDLMDYDLMVRDRLVRFCVDLNPGAVIRSLSLSAVCSVLQHQEVYHVYYMMADEAGNKHHKKASFYPLSGGSRLVCASLKDLSEAVEAETHRNDRLQQAVSTTRANLDANNAFLTLVNRDFRTPLHSILALTQLANSEIHDISVVEGYLHKISLSGTYMNETIDDIRDLIRVTSMPIHLCPETIYLPVFFQSLTNSVNSRVMNRQITFLASADDLPSETVMADRAALFQIITKLVNNLVNYSLPGASLTLTLDEDFSGSAAPGREDDVSLVITARTRGIDVAPDRLRVLKEPYQDLLDHLRDNINSIDIDLIILKAYASAMNGQFEIQSRKELDTKIRIRIPVTVAERTPSPDEVSYMGVNDIPDLHGHSVLLVDDNPINLEVGVRMLEHAGLEVSTAGNGQQAVELFTQKGDSIDLILMDIHMPFLDGLEATRQIRALSWNHAKEVPIIALTVKALPEDVQASMEAGMNEHLVKPFPPAELYRILQKYFV